MKRKLNDDDVTEPLSEPVAKVAKTETNTFASLDLDARLLQAITREKFTAPSLVQSRAIPLAVAGKDVLARARTGSGKTLAYLLPIIHSILRRKSGATKASKQITALVLVPTKELASQVCATLQTFTAFCAQDVRSENIGKKEDSAVTKARLAELPDIVVGTPGRASLLFGQDVLKLDGLQHLVIDEADLVLNYGYEDDLRTIAMALPAGVQKIFMSATLRTEVDTLTSLFFPGGEAKPTILDLSTEEAAEKPKLSQYVIRTGEDDKFLLLYAIFKLQLIKGKVIVFVADVDRCYRIKLFLEQFGIRSCVLNSELPVNSRLHAVEEFNRDVYDIIIASDENEIVGDESSGRQRRKAEKAEEAAEEEQEEAVEAELEHSAKAASGDEDESASKPTKSAKKERSKRNRKDREFGVSRGIDFRHVSCVLNFDLPTTSKSYTHRIGRTARAGQTGMALSFYVPRDLYRKHKPTSIPQAQHDEEVLAKIKAAQEAAGTNSEEWAFDMSKLEPFRYRFTDALRAVTRIAVREARTKELRQALINSEKLKRHFEENPEELRHLRHDTETHAVRTQPHLKHVPEYLLPSGGQERVRREVGFVGLRKEPENGLRKRRAFNKVRGKGRMMKGKGSDPLKSLNARGRGKK